MFLNLRRNSEHVDVLISGLARTQENKIFVFIKIHRNGHFNDLAAVYST